MKRGEISTEQFSYKENPLLRFTNSNYILAIKDEDYPEKNIIPIIYYDNGHIEDIDEYDMERIVVIPHKSINNKSLSRFNLNQLIKVSYGNIYSNSRYFDGSRVPKCSTIDSYIYETDKNDIIEVFDGQIDEPNSRIKIFETFLDTLILDVYVEANNPVFIQSDNNKIIGPFKIISKDSEGYFKVEKSLFKTFGEYKLTNDSYIEFTTNEIKRKIHLPSVNKLDIIKHLDFKDDKEVIKDFKIKLTENPKLLNKQYLTDLVDIITSISKIKSIQNHIKENNRIAQILKDTKDEIFSNMELATFLPEIGNIKKEIERLHDEEYELKSNINKYSTRKDETQQEVFEKQEELELLKSKVLNLKKTKEEELLKIKLDLEENIENLKRNKENLEIQIKEETENKSHELNILRKQLNELKTEKEDLDFTITELKQENRKVQRDAQEELINVFRHKKYFDFLSGRDLSEFDKKTDQIYSDYSIPDTYSDYSEFRTDLVSILNKHGRCFDTHFIDNLLISIHQNTLTILAGLPGTGKTSLARLLTLILSPKERISEVSVNRGWSSQKDLIGFLNPLTNKFHSAPTGVYELLTQLNYETKNGNYLNSPMAFIILDEANLSPIEHYWSTFYNLTDSIATQSNLLSISLGNNLNLEFANNLRFIATINYDQTTENLSPRVIDRANIIQIPPCNFNINNISVEEIKQLNISYKKCINFFNLCDFQEEEQNIEFSNDTNIIFSEIKKHFMNLRISISTRVEIAIKRYCYIAENWMIKEASRPLDYCIAQRLLPKINHQGDSAKNSLENLLDIFEKNDLKISSKILKRIIDMGNEDSIFEGNYNYFLTLTYA